MEKSPNDLTELERERFARHFYSICDSRLDDLAANCPWGCPWTWAFNATLRGATIEKMAENFYKAHKESIVYYLDNAKEA